MKVAKNPSKGVGGFLALLVAGLIFLGPLLGSMMTYAEISRTEESFPQLIDDARWTKMNVIVWTFQLLQIALTVSAGLLLLNRFRPSSVRFTIFVLWFGGAGLTLIAVYFISQVTGSEASANGAEIGRSLGQGIFNATLWTAYLLFSKRVKATYYVSDELEAGVAAATPTQRLSMAERWRALPLQTRKSVFFSLCWIAFILVWASFFDNDTTDFFQDGWDIDWGKVWTWALLPPAVYFALRWTYAKFVIADSDKDPA